MAQAPQVQTLEQIMAELNPTTSAQAGLIEKKKAGLGEKATAQQAALDATKAQSFDAISANQRGRGNAFSGIPADEQAMYLGTTYLPAVANLKASQNEQETSLEQQLADLYSTQYKSAYDTRTNQQSSVNQWNLAEMQNEFSASESEKNRQAQAALSAEEDTSPTPEQYMASAFAKMGSIPNWRKNYATENSGLVAEISANYGYSVKEARDKVYNYRKEIYGF